MTKIDGKYLTKVYKNGDYALKNCSLSVHHGEFLVIVGASGSGKSTLLRILSGGERLSSGELYFDGILADGIPSSKRDVSMVFQENLLYPHMTVFDNLATPLKIAGEDEKVIYDRVMDALRLFGLEIAADVKPRCLSGGEQQRAALAKALLRRSSLVLLDEPMSSVDEQARMEYCRALLKVKSLLPESTFIYVTHNSREAMMLADRIAVMYDGRILEVAPKDFLLNHFEYRQSMELLGPAFFNSDIEFDDSGRTCAPSYTELKLVGSLDSNNLFLENNKIELSSEYMTRLLHSAQDVLVAFDTEKFSKVALSDSISFIFEVLENGGDYVHLSTNGGSFILNERTNLKAGEKIRLYYKKDDITLYSGSDRLTCHYSLRRRIDINVIDSSRGIVRLFGKRVRLGRAVPSGAKYITVTADAFSLSYDKGNLAFPIVGCLDEEFINVGKLMHLAIKGVHGYLSIMADEEITFYGKNRLWLNINTDNLVIN